MIKSKLMAAAFGALALGGVGVGVAHAATPPTAQHAATSAASSAASSAPDTETADGPDSTTGPDTDTAQQGPGSTQDVPEVGSAG